MHMLTPLLIVLTSSVVRIVQAKPVDFQTYQTQAQQQEERFIYGRDGHVINAEPAGSSSMQLGELQSNSGTLTARALHSIDHSNTSNGSQQMPTPTQNALNARDAPLSGMSAFTWTTRTAAARPIMTMGGLIIPLHSSQTQKSHHATAGSAASTVSSAGSDTLPSGYAAQNATSTSTDPTATLAAGASSVAPTPSKGLQISLVNKMASNNIKMYMSGLDMNGSLIFLDQSGKWFYPQANGTTPQPIPSNVEFSLGGANTSLNFMTPGYIRSARIWISQGSLSFFSVATPDGPGLVQPAAVNPDDPNTLINYGFAEFDWEPLSGLYADITAVDFVGLPLGMELIDTDDNRFTALGTPANAAPVLCDMLKRQEDGVSPWGKQNT
jgi:hypothetical protein